MEILHSNVRRDQLIGHLRTDCLYFRGDMPCDPHRNFGYNCTCLAYVPVTKRGVIIKMGAAGDVLRTTPLLKLLNPLVTGTKILWITNYPELLPPDMCEAVKPNAALLARLSASNWDFCWNLDKDIESCALAFHITAKEKAGYTLVNGIPYPVDIRAWHKFATGINNSYSKENKKNYVQEICDIVGLKYNREEYCLKAPDPRSIEIAEKLLPGNDWIGLNTGAGWRWPTRIWPESHWIRLINLLRAQGFKPVIFGGPEEVDLNARLSFSTGCLWPGVQALDIFYAMINRCLCMVTSVTQAMHLAIAAKIPLVLFNNIFNSCEFELYGRGEVIEPTSPCDCFYDARCRTGRNCIDEITPEEAIAAIKRSIKC